MGHRQRVRTPQVELSLNGLPLLKWCKGQKFTRESRVCASDAPTIPEGLRVETEPVRSLRPRRLGHTPALVSPGSLICVKKKKRLVKTFIFTLMKAKVIYSLIFLFYNYPVPMARILMLHFYFCIEAALSVSQIVANDHGSRSNCC